MSLQLHFLLVAALLADRLQSSGDVRYAMNRLASPRSILLTAAGRYRPQARTIDVS